MQTVKKAAVVKLISDSSQFRDPVLGGLRDSSDLDAIRDGAQYAKEKFENYYSLMLEQDAKYKLAKEIGNKDLEEKYDRLFYETYKFVSYYDNESERLLALWSDKTGWPHLVSGEKGMEMYMPPEQIEFNEQPKSYLTIVK
jgi:hypothetical protein